jgi:ubiquinone/menaquinone biosynthesis C-methylase UbiE
MSRVDNEIAHGKKLAAEGAEEIWNWSSPAGQKRADRRANYFVELAKVKQGEKVLEIGCGTGLFTQKFFDATKAEITAIDISQDLLDEAKRNLPQVNFKKDDAMKLSFADESFDVVFGSSVLHHLDFKPALEEIYRVLKKGGRMIFAEPNMLNPQIFIQKNIPFIKKWLGDSPDETAIVRWSFKTEMQNVGFCSIKIFPYDFLHPSTPEFLIPLVKGIGNMVEKIPLLNEIAGSVIIYGEK